MVSDQGIDRQDRRSALVNQVDSRNKKLNKFSLVYCKTTNGIVTQVKVLKLQELFESRIVNHEVKPTSIEQGIRHITSEPPTLTRQNVITRTQEELS